MQTGRSYRGKSPPRPQASLSWVRKSVRVGSLRSRPGNSELYLPALFPLRIKVPLTVPGMNNVNNGHFVYIYKCLSMCSVWMCSWCCTGGVYGSQPGHAEGGPMYYYDCTCELHMTLGMADSSPLHPLTVFSQFIIHSESRKVCRYFSPTRYLCLLHSLFCHVGFLQDMGVDSQGQLMSTKTREKQCPLLKQV